jgi:SNF2 family DNA or RNA helicase
MGIVVEADWDGKHVVAKIPYALLSASRRIKEEVGGGFWKADKCWHYNPSLDTCYALRREFGKDLEVTKALAAWAGEQIAREKALAAIAASTDQEVPWLAKHAPVLASTLRPDQRVAAAFLALARRALLADQPGLGKTLETLAGFMNQEDPSGAYLVSSPRLSVSRVWAPEIKRWLPEDVAVYSTRGKWGGKNISTKAHRQAVVDAFMEDESPIKFLLVNHEMLRVKTKELEAPSFDNDWKGKYRDDPDYPDLFNVAWKGVAVDESHKTFGSLTITKGNMVGRGLRKLRGDCIREDGSVYAVTGTPYGKGGRVQGMFGTLHWLEPEKYTSFWRWAERWLVVEEDDYGHKHVLGLKTGDAEENVEAFYHSLGPVLIRRTKLEVLPNLPPKQYREVRCELVGEQKRQYLEFCKNGTVQLKSGAEIVGGGVLAEMMRKRQMANGSIEMSHTGNVYFPDNCDSGKLERLWQMMDERGILDGTDGVKMIVASQFKEFTDLIHKRLLLEEVTHHYLHGKVASDSARDQMMEDFQGKGGPRIFLMTSQTGGVSVTLDAADEVHCLDEMWNPEENEQLEDRAHRASRMHQVTIYYYRTEDTFDTYVAENVDDKAREQHSALDAKRGVPFLRTVMAESDARTLEEVK